MIIGFHTTRLYEYHEKNAAMVDTSPPPEDDVRTAVDQVP